MKIQLMLAGTRLDGAWWLARFASHITTALFLTIALCPARAQQLLTPSRDAQPMIAQMNGYSTEGGPRLEPANLGIWAGEVGEGFRGGTESFSLGLGASQGVAAFGGHEGHDLSLASLEYGRMLSRKLAEGNWFSGNFEFRAEIFAGAEFSPKREWLIGLTPHLRYNFITGTR